jgi:hypothetical protein
MEAYTPLFDAEKLSDWRRGADAALAAVLEARRTGDWEPLDRLADTLGIDRSPLARGAWEAICDALCSPLWR